MKKKRLSLMTKQKLMGWVFLLPAILFLVVFLFYPMFKGFLMSLETKTGYGISNYARLLKDTTLMKAVGNTLIYVLVEICIMLPLALLMAAVLQQKDLKFKGIYRVLLFIPCTMAMVSYTTVFKVMFGNYGLINSVLTRLGCIEEPIHFLTTKGGALFVISLCLVWRWSGYNMIYYCSGFSNIDHELYEAAEIDGASAVQRFFHITLPLLKPIILLTMITSVSGSLQILDEVSLMTEGGPANSTLSVSLHIYNQAFSGRPLFNYACAMAFMLFVLIALLTAIQRKGGDKREEGE